MRDALMTMTKRPGGYGVISQLAEIGANVAAQNPIAYVKSVILPDYNPPVPMPTGYPLPTVCIQLEDDFMIDPTADGSFALVFDPESIDAEGEDSVVLGLWHRGGRVTEDLWLSESKVTAGVTTIATKEDGLPDYIAVHDSIVEIHEKYRLTAACLTLEYIGRADEHSGFLAGGLLTDSTEIGLINFRSMREKCLFYQETHPIEGMRLTWIPLDVSDSAFRYAGGATTNPSMQKAVSALAYAGYDAVTKKYSGTKAVLTEAETNLSHLKGAALAASNLSGSEIELFWGAGQRQVLVLFGIGLPTATGAKFRGKITRNFECVPKSEYRKLVGGSYTHNVENTAKFLSGLIKVMPEIVSPPLYQSGDLKVALEAKSGALLDSVDLIRTVGDTVVAPRGTVYKRGSGTFTDLLDFVYTT